MTEDRSMLIADVLTADVEEAKKLFAMTPEEAVIAFKEKGVDVTKEELIEFGKELEKTAKIFNENDELDEESLSAISGGCRKCFTAGLWTVAIGLTVAGAMW